MDIEANELPQYLGVYQINENESRSVTMEDGHLYTQRTGGGRLEIVAHAEDAFFYPGGFTHLVFRRDRDGNVIAMDMYQNGSDQAERAERVSDVAHGQDTTADVSAEVYDLWAGNYALDSGATLEVRRDGDHLHVQMTGQPQFEVFPLSVNRYFLKVVDAEVEFTAGEDGRGKTAVIYQNGTETVANRVD